jgi:sporulation protein YlmC with PRC-barrel domain
MKQTTLRKAVQSLFVPIALGLSASAFSQADKAQQQRAPASAASTQSASQQQAQNLGHIRASVLMDAKVTDRAGRDIGEVEDLIVQMNSGEVRYAAVTLSGLEGVSRDRIFAVPVRDLKRSTKEDKVVLDTSAQRVKQMRSWEKDSWQTAFDDRNDRRQAANETRREAREESREARQADRSEAREERREARVEQREANRTQAQAKGRAAAGSGAPAAAAGNDSFRASKLIGKNVENPQGEKLGELKDLVIDANGQKAQYAVLGFDPGILSRERNHAFPLQRFTARLQRDGDVDKLVLNASKEQLKELSGFSDRNWPDFNDRTYVSDLNRRFDSWRGDRSGASVGTGGSRDANVNRNTNANKDRNPNR